MIDISLSPTVLAATSDGKFTTRPVRLLLRRRMGLDAPQGVRYWLGESRSVMSLIGVSAIRRTPLCCCTAPDAAGPRTERGRLHAAHRESAGSEVPVLVPGVHDLAYHVTSELRSSRFLSAARTLAR